MPAEGPVTTPGGAAPVVSRWTGRRVTFLVVALLLELVVLGSTVTLGLAWGGPTYVVAVVAAALGLGAVVWLAGRRPGGALVVPLVSALMTVLLLVAGHLLARVTECSPDERAAFAELAPPPGTTIELRGEMGNGCIARFDPSLSGAEIAAHYEHEFTAHGWQAGPLGSDAVGNKNGIVVRIDRVEGEGGLVIVTVGER